MKKTLAMLLVLMISVSFAVLGTAEDTSSTEYSSGDYRYTVNADGNAVITKYSGHESSVNVPTVLGGYFVVGIGEDAFCGCSSLKSISLPEGIQSIDDFAFEYCDGLKSISLPASLQYMGYAVFYYCPKLTSIEVSADSLIFTVEDGVLFRKEDRALIVYPAGKTIVEYYVPQGIQSIAGKAFSYCSPLKSINLPEGIQSIGETAFDHCDALISINLPDSLQSIGKAAFFFCTSLTAISLPPNLQSIGEWAFYNCTSLTAISLPASLQAIGDGAFFGCSSLTAISLPASLQPIGSAAAFYGCDASIVIVP